MSPVWQLTAVSRRFRQGWWGRQTAALDGVDLVVRRGERLAIVGPSGSGKTTLVRCGLGLERVDAGQIRLFGAEASSAEWRTARRRTQLLFQDPRAMLHPNLPIGLLLEESATLHRRDADPVRVAAEALRAVGLADRGLHRPRELSGGERRRAGLARVLIARPELLVADEPTAGLDADLRRDMVDLLCASCGPQTTLVVVTHDLATVAPVCDRMVVLDQGRVVEELSRASLSGGGVHPVTRALLGAA